MANLSAISNGSNKKIFFLFGLFLIFFGFLGYFLIPSRLWYYSYAALAFGFIAGVLCLLASPVGKKFIGFAKDSYREVLKVVWPTKKEAFQTTMAVFLFVLIMATFLWLSDKLIEWGVFSVILGWK